MTSLQVILDDSKVQSVFKFNLWIYPSSEVVDGDENSDSADPDEPEKPVDPEPEDPIDEENKDSDNKPTDTSAPSDPTTTTEPVKPENLFDPSTLYARNQSRERVREERVKVLASIDPGEVEELPDPKTKIE